MVSKVWRQLDRLGLPLVQLSQLAAGSPVSVTYRDESQQSAKLYKLLNLHGKRGRVGRDASADLAVFDLRGNVEAKAAIDWSRLARVMVAGETVWKDGKRAGGTPGIFLRRT